MPLGVVCYNIRNPQDMCSKGSEEKILKENGAIDSRLSDSLFPSQSHRPKVIPDESKRGKVKRCKSMLEERNEG